ncbi:MAG: heavy metal translocating P-type ATPase, partial [Nitrospinae bacterium CG11_big_fil_rev_8_21_14_0_20_56_8]
DTILFDKTGTLTHGKPEVTDVILEPDASLSLEQFLVFAASLEKQSEHPLAEAVLQEVERRSLKPIKVEHFIAIPGYGIEGRLGGQNVLLGNAKLMKERGVDLSRMEDRLDHMARQGKTLMILAAGDRAQGILAAADTVKPHAREAVLKLLRMGLEVIMVTGDNPSTAKAIAGELGIHTVLSEVLPGEKDAVVTRLQGEGKFVAMVGDGINDAPALARADIGIAIGTGTDIAMEASDITLMGKNLVSVADAIELSKRTLGKIKQNLFWAFFYNCLGIPIAAGLLYPFFGILLKPLFAAAAMSFSSVSVVGNSLLLKRFRPSRSDGSD